MALRISFHTHEKIPCFKVFGELANHLDSIARYVGNSVSSPQGFVLDIRAVTARPLADKVFIHVLKYPPGLACKFALVDLKENLRFCSLYERLAGTRGYRVRHFASIEMAYRWLLSEGVPPKASHSRFNFLTHGLTLVRRSLNPAHQLHARSTLH